MGAAYRAHVTAVGHGFHGGGAVGKGVQAVCQRCFQLKLAQHLHDVDARRRFERVWNINATGSQKRCFERGGAAHIDCQRPGFNSHTGFHHTDSLSAARLDLAAGGQLRNQGFGQDQHIARRASEQPVFHHANSAESSRYAASMVCLKLCRQVPDQALSCTAPHEFKRFL